MTSVHIQNLSLTMGNRRLLDDVSIRIEQGERVAIVGPNGAGKTTLLRCLLGFIPRAEGVVELQENTLSTLSRRQISRMIGYVPQRLEHEIPFTVLEFIMMSRYAHTNGTFVTRDNDGEKIARQAAERVGIVHLQNQTMSTLSGGERQKVNIAAAMAQQTPILVLDEPSAHLDPKQRESIHQLLGEIGRKSKTTILTVTHDLNWAAMDFDRIIGMAGGKVVADDTPAAFITTENLQHIFEANWTVQTHPESGHPFVLPAQHRPKD